LNRRKTCSLTSFAARAFQGSNPVAPFAAHELFAAKWVRAGHLPTPYDPFDLGCARQTA
jgi:hypothetical protein